ncbi:MAG: heavy metal-responsive transcriptional regulator [Bacteroidetes bacterium]|nr:MAG: heavy metal-responsive transcriptional regulator [Bacteroidota bacterium]
MLIGEIAQKTNLSRDTIRFYEKKGLIQVERTVSEWNNYKDYKEETLHKLILIKKAKGFGFTLNEISDIITMYDLNEATCEIMGAKIKEKLHTIDKKISDLQEMKMTIIRRVEQARNECISTPKANCQSL